MAIESSGTNILVLVSRRTATYGLINGGRAGMVYVYIGSFVGFFASVVSMAEISSVYVNFTHTR